MKFRIGDKVILKETGELCIIVERYFWGLLGLLILDTKQPIWVSEKEDKIEIFK